MRSENGEKAYEKQFEEEKKSGWPAAFWAKWYALLHELEDIDKFSMKMSLHNQRQIISIIYCLNF